MGIASSIVVYIIAWWLIFFISLPFGISQDDCFVPGQDRGAPKKGHLKLKFLISTIGALILLVAYGWFQGAGFVSFR